MCKHTLKTMEKCARGTKNMNNRNEKSTVEIDFIIRSADSLIPIEVKASDNPTKSLRKLTEGKNAEIKYGIKLCHKNIGFNGYFYTIPYFMTFSLKDFVSELNKTVD